MARYKGRPLGTLGSLGALSFHETKNIISGEGGALAVNDPGLTGRAEIIWEKGTDRTSFERGEIDKYTWQDIGSSYLPSEITAAFLLAQLEAAEAITAGRLEYWHYYHGRLAELERRGFLRRPVIPPDCQPNGHIYHILVDSPQDRRDLLDFLRGRQIQAVFHYVPLHSSPAGRRYGRAAGELKVTDDLWARLIRLPLWNGMDVDILDRVVRALEDFYARPAKVNS
jgi:dTDP-4-amino-4,6-dideoxygalactose transaminase